LAAGVLVIALGLGSRGFAASLPSFIADYAGDTLWATAAFIAVAFLAPDWPRARLAGAALAVSFAVEVSQLYHAPWIDALRRTLVGRLTLGAGFLWSDLVCYAAGVLLAVALDARWLQSPPSVSRRG
jgi:hypothetical protein